MSILTLIIALVAIIVAILALVIQSRRFEKTAAQQEAWERAQQSHLRSLEAQQERRITALETRFTTEFKEVQEARQKWETTNVARLETLAKDYQAAATQSRLEHELARIPRIEDIPLSTDAHGQTRPAIVNWRPLMLFQADLHKLDLSHRYLGYADLREAQLVGATLFMTNLSGANLSGADLSNADLSGTDLSGADLHGATLTGANLMVADLQNAVLTGANLLGVRNLTTQQLHSATYDSTTLLDNEIDATPARLHEIHRGNYITSAHMEAVHPVMPSLPVTPVPVPATEPSAPSDTSDRQSEPSSETLLPDMTLFTQQSAEQAPLSSLTSGDSLPDPKVADLLVDRQENKGPGESDTALPRRKHNGKRATKRD